MSFMKNAFSHLSTERQSVVTALTPCDKPGDQEQQGAGWHTGSKRGAHLLHALGMCTGITWHSSLWIELMECLAGCPALAWLPHASSFVASSQMKRQRPLGSTLWVTPSQELPDWQQNLG